MIIDAIQALQGVMNLVSSRIRGGIDGVAGQIRNPVHVYRYTPSRSEFALLLAMEGQPYCVEMAGGRVHLRRDQVVPQLMECAAMYDQYGQGIRVIPRPPEGGSGSELSWNDYAAFKADYVSRTGQPWVADSLRGPSPLERAIHTFPWQW